KRTLTLVLSESPQSVFALAKMGQLSAQSGDRAGALEFFDRALKAAPNQPLLREMLSAEFRRQGNAAKAEAYAGPAPSSGRKRTPIRYPDPLAVEVAAHNRSAMQKNVQGVRMVQRGRYQDVLPYFESASAANPHSAPVLVNLGMTQLGLGETKQAQSTL